MHALQTSCEAIKLKASSASEGNGDLVSSRYLYHKCNGTLRMGIVVICGANRNFVPTKLQLCIVQAHRSTTSHFPNECSLKAFSPAQLFPFLYCESVACCVPKTRHDGILLLWHRIGHNSHSSLWNQWPRISSHEHVCTIPWSFLFFRISIDSLDKVRSCPMFQLTIFHEG